MRALLRRLGLRALAGFVAACTAAIGVATSPEIALAQSARTCIYEGGSVTTPTVNIPSFSECDASRNLMVSISSGTISITFPYAGTNGQTLTTASFLGVGALDANGKFSPLQEDASQNLLTKVNVALPTGANVIGGVTGSGNFTVIQPTGTNLHAVLDTTSTTAVTQATASNLNAAVVGTGTAGTSAGGVLSIQGVASGTAVPMSCSSGATCPVNATLQTGSNSVGLITMQDQGSSGIVTPISCDNSASVAISTATTTSIVAISGSTAVYVCGISLWVSGAGVTAQLEYGTGATCGTGTTVLSGAVGSATMWASGGGKGTILRTPAGQRLCIVSTGASPNIQGFISFAQF